MTIDEYGSLINAVAERDVRTLARFVNQHGAVFLNPERGAIQARACDGVTLLLSLPVADEVVRQVGEA